jgi:small-conductance mechanosensitive channel
MLIPIALLLAQAEESVMPHWAFQLIATGLTVVVALSVQWALRRVVLRQKISSSDLRRRWLVQIRNLALLAIAIGIILIWGTEIRTAAISLVAIVAAIVIATKELILCLTGGFYKILSQAFSLGDQIEVGNMRGEVIDQTLLSTRIIEIAPAAAGGQTTGREITIPNMVFLSQPIYNDSLNKTYILHAFSVPVKQDENWKKHEEALLAAAAEVCSPYLDKAKRAIEVGARQEGLEAPTVEPRLSIALPAPDRIDMSLRVPCPEGRRGRIQQQIVRRYLELLPPPPPKDAESQAADN